MTLREAVEQAYNDALAASTDATLSRIDRMLQTAIALRLNLLLQEYPDEP